MSFGAVYLPLCNRWGVEPIPGLTTGSLPTELNLNGNSPDRITRPVGDTDVIALCDALVDSSERDSLQSIDFSHSSLTNACILALRDVIEVTPSLQRINIAYNSIDGDAPTVERFIRTLSSRRITHISLEGNPLGDAAGAMLAQLVADGAEVASLNITDTGLSSTALHTIAISLLSPSRALQELAIGGPWVLQAPQAEAIYDRLADALAAPASQLRSLAIPAAGMTGFHLAALERGLMLAPLLRGIDLSGNPLAKDTGDILARVMAERHALGKTPLRVIKLSGCPIGNASAVALARAIEQYGHALWSLELERCRLTAAGVVALAEACRGCGSLSIFKVGGNPLDMPDAVEALYQVRDVFEKVDICDIRVVDGIRGEKEV